MHRNWPSCHLNCEWTCAGRTFSFALCFSCLHRSSLRPPCHWSLQSLLSTRTRLTWCITDLFGNSNEAVACEGYRRAAPRIYNCSFVGERSSNDDFCEHGVVGGAVPKSIRACSYRRAEFRWRPIWWCGSQRQLLIRLGSDGRTTRRVARHSQAKVAARWRFHSLFRKEEFLLFGLQDDDARWARRPTNRPAHPA